MTNSPELRRFLRCFFEMLLAMVLGMAVLGLLFAGVLLAAGTSYSEAERDAPALVLIVMAFSMTAPMAVWMRHRRFAPARVAEMSGAMAVLTAVFLAALASGAVDGGKSLLDVQHGAMVPLMLGVMLLRRRHYSRESIADTRTARTSYI